MNGLIIFLKSPSADKVKTRLAQDVGEVAAREVYTALVRHTLSAARKVNCLRLLFIDGPGVSDLLKNDSDFLKHHQHGSDLGERMSNAFELTFDGGCDKVVIIGSDIPDLTAEIIEGAFDALDKNDFVIGPANDGGYYLLGMKELNRGVFKGINWSSPSVLAQTKERIEAIEGRATEIEKLTDLDTIDDLDHIANPHFNKIIETHSYE